MDLTNEIIAYIEYKYQITPDHPWISYPDYMTFKDPYSDKWFALIMKVDGRRLGRKEALEIPVVNVKGSPEFIGFITQTEGYVPAYHMSKKHWMTIILDGTVSLEQVLERIDESYDLINNTPTRRIYEATKKIPKGKVATYGQVAELAGDRKMARAVGNALHKNPDPENIPCYRVVNSKGELAGEFAFGGEGAQAKLLLADGIEVADGKVDLAKYGIIVAGGKIE